MLLSVIIVNYNVKYFLEQCLNSVFKALEGILSEVIVVDNNSVDGSVEMLKEKYKNVILIENKKNTGFSFANNQAIKIANGKYVLLLNPDTVVQEDTFQKTISFMEQHNDAGGLGVMMVDGKGNFLPESKRALPTPMVAFYKIFGLSALFPKSEKFGRYHLGFLDKNKIHEVEILSGAFMMIRKEALNKTGLLDEDYFMYGEDIDLSYRIIKAGYKNYYFPETKIIHYKGESTKKSSVNYVFVFYRAMIIFAEKHFSQNNAKVFSLLINTAIYIRASFAIVSRFIKQSVVPFTDFLIAFVLISFFSVWWEIQFKLPLGESFPEEYFRYAIPSYIIFWLLSLYYSGGYDKPISVNKFAKGFFIGTIVILSIYALLPEHLRFSRGIILFGSVLVFITLILFRWLLNISGLKNYSFSENTKKKIAIVGEKNEISRIADILKLTLGEVEKPIFVSSSKENDENLYAGNISQLSDIVTIYKINEVIYCAKDVSAQDIISSMSETRNNKLEFKIAPPEGLYIIGSNSIDNQGELYVVDINAVDKPYNLRIKRLIDLLGCILVFTSIPLIFSKCRKKIIRNFWAVLTSKKTWIGYSKTNHNLNSLPKIKEGVFSMANDVYHLENNEEKQKINRLYAKDYKAENDIKTLVKIFFSY